MTSFWTAIARRVGPVTSTRWFALALSFAIPGTALLIYLLLGSPMSGQRLPEPAQASPSNPHATSSVKEVESRAAELADRLQRAPKDAEGWATLARSYQSLGRYSESAAAYAKAAALVTGDAQLLADYADALAMSRDRRLDGEPLRLVERALKIDPDNLKALSLAGTAAFDRKDYVGALKYWQRVLRVAPPDSDYAEMVKSSIREAEALAAAKPPQAALAAGPAATPATPLATPLPVTGATIKGKVKLHSSLAAKVAPTDTVFIFARSTDGSRAPLAVVMRSAKELPIEFLLDDSTAMTPARNLSSVSSVVVFARISKTGNATAQPGDLQGMTGPVKVGASGIEVEIREVVK